MKNPRVLTGAGIERAPEREVITIAQVWELADAVEARFRGLGPHRCVHRASPRRAVRPHPAAGRPVAPHHHRLEQRQQLRDGSLVVGPPKTAAGVRTVALPGPLVPELETHLATYCRVDADALVFTGEKGGPLRDHVWQAAWVQARHAAGLPHLHFHDLRHVANTLTAATGASTRELMHRMGHASPAAALRYQHATRGRDAAIAATLGES